MSTFRFRFYRDDLCECVCTQNHPDRTPICSGPAPRTFCGHPVCDACFSVLVVAR